MFRSDSYDCTNSMKLNIAVIVMYRSIAKAGGKALSNAYASQENVCHTL